MKPTRNKTYCPSIGRIKMLFETQSKADNFIKFNRDKILEENGKAPIRSYYCRFCMGWHVTSNASVTIGEMLDKREEEIIKSITDRPQKTKPKKNITAPKSTLQQELIEKFNLSIIQIEKAIFAFQTSDEIMGFIEGSHKLLDEIKSSGLDKTTYLKKYEEVLKLYEAYKLIIENKDEVEESAKHTKFAKRVSLLKNNYSIVKKMDDTLPTLKSAAEDYSEDFLEFGKKARQMVKNIKGNYSKYLRERYNLQINDIEKLYITQGKKLKEEILNQTLLNIIYKIEMLPQLYDNGEVKKCEEILESCNDQLIGYEKSDKVNIIQRHIDNWRVRIIENYF